MDEPRIGIAPQDTIDKFPGQVDRILVAMLGHTRAMVTDESLVSDFTINIAQAQGDPDVVKLNNKILGNLEALMGRPVDRHEYLWAMARELWLSEREGQD